MNMQPLHRAIVLALAAPFTLAACGGGGGGMVRSAPPPNSPPPPVSPPPAAPPPSTQKTINEGTLAVLASETLTANVTIGPDGALSLIGTIKGNIPSLNQQVVAESFLLEKKGGVETRQAPANDGDTCRLHTLVLRCCFAQATRFQIDSCAACTRGHVRILA